MAQNDEETKLPEQFIKEVELQRNDLTNFIMAAKEISKDFTDMRRHESDNAKEVALVEAKTSLKKFWIAAIILVLCGTAYLWFSAEGWLNTNNATVLSIIIGVSLTINAVYLKKK